MGPGAVELITAHPAGREYSNSDAYQRVSMGGIERASKYRDWARAKEMGRERMLTYIIISVSFVSLLVTTYDTE